MKKKKNNLYERGIEFSQSIDNDKSLRNTQRSHWLQMAVKKSKERF